MGVCSFVFFVFTVIRVFRSNSVEFVVYEILNERETRTALWDDK